MVVRLSVGAVGALCILLLAGLAGCNKMTRANYDKVQTGMTVAEVEDILGTPAETKSGGAEALGFAASARRLTWKSGDKTITVTFVNDKVVQKDMSNL